MSGIPGGTADDVLVKIVEKVRGHFMHTGHGSGPTLHVFMDGQMVRQGSHFGATYFFECGYWFRPRVMVYVKLSFRLVMLVLSYLQQHVSKLGVISRCIRYPFAL